MWKVDIYLEADSKAQKNTERKCAYILETICAGAIKTAEGFQCISGTYHSATLQNLVAALSRIRKTSNVCVHTEDPRTGQYRSASGIYAGTGARTRYLEKETRRFCTGDP